MAQTSISIRMDADLKKNFENFCGAVGMNMSTAINMFAIACVRAQKVPFEISSQRSLQVDSLGLFADTVLSHEESLQNNTPRRRGTAAKGASCMRTPRFFCETCFPSEAHRRRVRLGALFFCTFFGCVASATELGIILNYTDGIDE